MLLPLPLLLALALPLPLPTHGGLRPTAAISAAGSGSSNDGTDLPGGRAATPCGAELHAVCGDACHAADEPRCSFACVQCAGDHQRALQVVGCDNKTVAAFCAGAPSKKPAAPIALHGPFPVSSGRFRVGGLVAANASVQDAAIFYPTPSPDAGGATPSNAVVTFG